jgi:hypothetical protein
MQNPLDEYFLQNPLRIAERTRLTMSLATALWNAQHDKPMNGTALHLFLCDETRGDLSEEQKCFVRKCKVQADQIYLRMLCDKEHESEAMCRPALPARSRCVRFFCRNGACTPLLVVRPLWAVLGGFRGTKVQAG